MIRELAFDPPPPKAGQFSDVIASPPPSMIDPSNDNEKYENCTFCPQEDMSSLCYGPPQVTMLYNMGSSTQCQKILLCAPVEFYSGDNLRENEHRFDYGKGAIVLEQPIPTTTPPGIARTACAALLGF